MGITIIDETSLSFESIFEDLKKYVESKPDDKSWKDFYASGAGTTLLELISGLGSYNAYRNLMRRRESYLETAALESSIYELAFNRGFMVAPSHTLELDVVFRPAEQLVIDYGQQLATADRFDAFSLETKSIGKDETVSVHCVCGYKHTFTQAIQGLVPFQTFNFTFSNKYCATTFESLKIDDEDIILVSDLNYIQKYGSNFVLRRVLANEVKIYTGNGILGWYNESATILEYTCLTYNTNSFENTDLIPVIEKPQDTWEHHTVPEYYDVEITGQTEHVAPVFGADKEEVRNIAMFYPIDGRIVTESDYQYVTMKYFGGVLTDVFSINIDHTENVHLLVDNNFTSGNFSQIVDLINLKRGAGIKVEYYIKTRDESDLSFVHDDLIEISIDNGIPFTCNFTVEIDQYYEGLLGRVNTYLSYKLLKFMKGKEDTIITTVDFAIELSSYFGIEFFPVADHYTTLSTDVAAGDLAVCYVADVASFNVADQIYIKDKNDVIEYCRIDSIDTVNNTISVDTLVNSYTVTANTKLYKGTVKLGPTDFLKSLTIRIN